MSEGVGLREFGRLVGVSGEAIRKAIKSERIPARMVGSKKLSSGRLVPIISDVDGARAAFGANTDPTQRRAGARISAGKRAANAEARGDEAAAEHHRQTLADAPCGPTLNDKNIPSIAESRAKTEAYKAEITKLEYEEKAKRLVDAEEFRTKYTAKIATARTQMLGVPSKAKGRIPHLTIEEIAILTDLIREALEEAADAG